MGKTNKQIRALDEKQHHVSKAIKKEANEKSVKYIDRALKNKRFEVFYDEIEHEQEYINER